MPRRISADNAGQPAASARRPVPVNVVILTLDSHMASAAERARIALFKDLPGIHLTHYAVAEWAADPKAADACRNDIARADVIIANMIFLDEHVRLVGPWLEARRNQCDAIIACMSAAEIVKLTRLGGFDMQKPAGGMIGLLKRLRGSGKPGASGGRSQMKLLRSLPRLLKYIPGKAQDVRAFFLSMQYLLAGSDENIANLVRFLIARYAAGERAELRNTLKYGSPVEYPETGLYHPALKDRVTDDPAVFAKASARTAGQGNNGTVGVLVMRSYLLADNTAHFDGVINALEGRGLKVLPAFASGLDARPAIENFFIKDGRPVVDAVVSLTGFSLVGGPAYNDAAAAEEILARLDVPYLSAFAVEFQTLEEWEAGDQGLTPVETTIMVAIPEIDGASGPIIYGGRSLKTGGERDMAAHPERAEMLASRIARLVRLRRKARAERKIATIIYNFPPNGGAVGTAAYLSVFRSLFNTLKAMKAEGYSIDLPADWEALRDAILIGNSERYGAATNVAHFVEAETHVRTERWLPEIEKQWGPAPGRHQSDGRRIFVLGARFGNVFVGVQPAFGYEGDPMRLLFEKGFAPTHAFAAFYRYLREGFGADAYLHFGTHGALEFMPGKQVGLSSACWPDRLLADVPNFYLYAANNPSEGTIARRRSAATLISYLTPPLVSAGLYRGLIDLKSSIDRWRGLAPDMSAERVRLAETIKAQAVALDLAPAEADWSHDGGAEVPGLAAAVAELEATLIPHGLHVVGEPMEAGERADMLASVNSAFGDAMLEPAVVERIARGETASSRLPGEKAEAARTLEKLNIDLSVDHELAAMLHALDGGYIRPVSGGDIIRTPSIVPTGRNLHGFDPFRLPSAHAVAEGSRQAVMLLDRYQRDHGSVPKSIALVMWGTDTLKTEGAPIGQALALIGAKPRFDGFGRLAGAELMSLEELGRPRIDVVITLSGIFRDLLPLQTKLLAQACLMAAQADEPLEMNHIRANALAWAAQHDCDFETAALRVFSNASGAYGSNVNLLVDSGAWEEEDELAETYTRRKCFAYGVDGKPVRQEELLRGILGKVETAFQNIESVELGITSIDHYFDTLGGISRAVREAGGGDMPVYVGDQNAGRGKVRTLSEQVALETRTRMLNPKWYEGLLQHGYEGVRQIESHVTNTLGWSATTGQVEPWVYKNLTETFVLDETMRRRLSELNPKASSKLANRLIEAVERKYWNADEETLRALRDAGEELEDRVEGIKVEAAA